MKFKSFLILPFLGLLAGCTQHKVVDLRLHYITANSAPVQTTDPNSQAQLAEAAASVGHSLQQLSAMQTAIHPNVRLPNPPNPASIGMAQQTSLDWTGPIEPLLKKIAQTSNYRVHVLGKRPAIPAIVQINEQDVPLYYILRDATYQVVKKADITLYPSRRIIELRYKSL